MTEFELIDAFTRDAARGGEGVVLGIGDDAAVVRAPPGEELVLTVDAVVEGVHFTDRFGPADVGWKALAVNLSDLAAMGARPLWALCALATPREERPARLAGVGRGLAACARAHGIALVGGNVTRARDLSVTVTVVGAVPRGRAIRRSGGRAGDRVLVSGSLGGAALGIASGARRADVLRQRRPTPRLALGRALLGIASGGLDVSDGLLQDLGHLCSDSGVGARVEAERLPLARGARDARDGEALLRAALAGGEDYELLVAVPPRRVAAAQGAAARCGVPLTEIGVLTPAAGVRVVDGAGRAVEVGARGHDHLARRRSP